MWTINAEVAHATNHHTRLVTLVGLINNTESDSQLDGYHVVLVDGNGLSKVARMNPHCLNI